MSDPITIAGQAAAAAYVAGPPMREAGFEVFDRIAQAAIEASPELQQLRDEAERQHELRDTAVDELRRATKARDMAVSKLYADSAFQLLKIELDETKQRLARLETAARFAVLSQLQALMGS